MLNPKILEKLSNRELKLYLSSNSRYTPEAIQLAFEILQKRGIIFSEEEKLKIEQLIQSKKEEEIQKKQEEIDLEKDYITDDESAISLYPRALVIAFGFCLGAFSGSVLLALNLIKLKKYKDAFGVLFFGIAFTILQYFLVNLLYETRIDSVRYRASPELLFASIGALLLYFIWIECIPKKMPYRSGSIIVPLVLGILTATLIYFNYNGWFSSYLIVNLAK